MRPPANHRADDRQRPITNAVTKFAGRDNILLFIEFPWTWGKGAGSIGTILILCKKIVTRAVIVPVTLQTNSLRCCSTSSIYLVPRRVLVPER